MQSDPFAVCKLNSWSRRSVIQSAAGGSLGLTLGSLFRAQAALGDHSSPLPAGSRIRSCILLFYYGGPSQFETYDLKPHAPAEIRGEFQPISTSVPGLSICEHLPRMSQLMHHVALVRSVHHKNRLHDSASTEALTGRPSPNGDREEFGPIPQFFPCYGSTLQKLWNNPRVEIPHAALPFVFHNVVDVPCQGGGFLGNAFDPLQINLDENTKLYRAGSLDVANDSARRHLEQRRHLLEVLENQRHAHATGAAIQEMRRLYDKAYRLLNSESLRRALDLTLEPEYIRARYGFGKQRVAVGEGGGGGNGAEMGIGREMRGQNLLLARRLVEAGVPFINVYDFKQQGQNWDAHFRCANQHKTHLLPQADQALSALIEDLDLRGLLDSTLVVAMGEFGRTPRINEVGGRDHWPDCYTVLFAGGGVKGGFVYGASDKIGAFPALDPVTPGDIAATIFWRFGIDPATEIHDLTGRPHRIATGQPIEKLFA